MVSDKEVWVKFSGHEETHMVSSLGKFKSIDRIGINGSRYPSRELSLGVDKDGYKLMFISSNGFRKTYRAHRIVYISFFGEILGGLHVDHIDGDKGNNCVSNLQLLTSRENTKKAMIDNNGKCGYRKMGKKYQVRKNYFGKTYSLGVFSTEAEAERIFNDADFEYCLKNNTSRAKS